MDSSKTNTHNSSSTDTTVVAASSPTQDSSYSDFINNLSPLSEGFSPISELSKIENCDPFSEAGVSITDAEGIQEIQESSRAVRSPALPSTESDSPAMQNENIGTQSLNEVGTEGNSDEIKSMSPSPSSTSAIPQSNNSTEPAENKPRNVDPNQSDLKKIDKPGTKRKKKKTISINISGEGDSSNFKPCKCKKIHCLNYQCVCFRNKYYCDESCSCKDCFNNAANENTLLQRKEKSQLNK